MAAAARELGVGRGTLDGILGGRHGMGGKTHQAVTAYLRNLSPSDAKHVKDIGRAAAYAAGSTTQGGPSPGTRLRGQVQRLKSYSPENQKKEVSFFVRRVQEASGKTPGRRGSSGGYGGGAGGGSGYVDETDAEWFAEYGAWVEQVEAWRGDVDGELPELEELPF